MRPAQEIVAYTPLPLSLFSFLKLDFEKTFGSMNWPFLVLFNLRDFRLSVSWLDNLFSALGLFVNEILSSHITCKKEFCLDDLVRILSCFQEKMMVQENPIELEKTMAWRRSKSKWSSFLFKLMSFFPQKEYE